MIMHSIKTFTRMAITICVSPRLHTWDVNNMETFHFVIMNIPGFMASLISSYYLSHMFWYNLWLETLAKTIFIAIPLEWLIINPLKC